MASEKRKEKKGSEDPERNRLSIHIWGYRLDSSPPLESGAEGKDILNISIGYNLYCLNQMVPLFLVKDRFRNNGVRCYPEKGFIKWWQSIQAAVEFLLYSQVQLRDFVLIVCCGQVIDSFNDLMQPYSSKSSTCDRDLRTCSRLNMLSVSMKIKNVLILDTVPVLSISASLVVPALGLGFLICTCAPILISLLASSPFCFALALCFQAVVETCCFCLLRCCLDRLWSVECAFLVVGGLLGLELMVIEL